LYENGEITESVRWRGRGLKQKGGEKTMQQVFDTERLRVFTTDAFTPSEFYRVPRRLYAAFAPDDRHVHTLLPVVTVLVGDLPMMGLYVDWIETTTEYREEGYAKEVLTALARHLLPRPLTAFAGTDEGEALLTGLVDAEDVIHPPPLMTVAG
jgi:hypothetical protein